MSKHNEDELQVLGREYFASDTAIDNGRSDSDADSDNEDRFDSDTCFESDQDRQTMAINPDIQQPIVHVDAKSEDLTAKNQIQCNERGWKNCRITHY